MSASQARHASFRFFLLCALLVASVAVVAGPPRERAPAHAFIVQSSSSAQAAQAVHAAGGTVKRQLNIINSVSATLDSAAEAQLRRDPSVIVYRDAGVRPGIAELNDPPPVPTSTDPWLADLREKSQKETDTAGRVLYASAATAAYLSHDVPVLTRKTVCTPAGVVETGADEFQPLRGKGVTVAIIDSGFTELKDADRWQQLPDGSLFASNNSDGRCVVYHDFLGDPATLPGEEDDEDEEGEEDNEDRKVNSSDPHGHGTHVSGIIADRRTVTLAQNTEGFAGVAPDVNLLVARALGPDGGGVYSDIIAAIEWVIENQAKFNVRVLNLSLYATPSGPYWADPLNQAVMRAWQAGIVVVVAAGNSGPGAATITVPGNVPYVITVGALNSGRYTEDGYDALASYSSRGPTESAFIKPDVVVPATRVLAPVPEDSTLGVALFQACARRAAQGDFVPCLETKAPIEFGMGDPAQPHGYYYVSGTSMGAAEVSGVVALMLQSKPGLTNNQVKYQLLATARSAIDEATGDPLYSVWEEGAGLVDTDAAIELTSDEAANAGMDIDLDLDVTSANQVHYWGWTVWDETTGEFRWVYPDSNESLDVWAGGSRVWAGGSRVWAGGSRVWAGGSRVWAGGSRVWAGSTTWAYTDSLWAGGSRVWAGSVEAPTVESASRAEMMIDRGDYSACGAVNALYCSALPLITSPGGE